MIRWLLAGMIGLVSLGPVLAQKFDGLALAPPSQ
jgi:hypothetical protein